VANCQVAVTLHWSSVEASCPLGWRLYFRIAGDCYILLDIVAHPK
jgi:hypothetical protein